MPLVVIEVPRYGMVKRSASGAVDFVSPIPCPFGYGSVPGTIAADGDPVDAVVLGPSGPRGTRVYGARVVGVVRFVDAGRDDDKLVCSPHGRRMSRRERALVRIFFASYALAKRGLYRWRRVEGRTRYLGLTDGGGVSSIRPPDPGDGSPSPRL